MAVGEFDDLAEELLVDLSEDVRRENRGVRREDGGRLRTRVRMEE